MATRSMFLSAPPEIRLRIYDWTVVSINPITVVAATAASTDDESWDIEPRPLSSQLFRTCRQVRDEAVPHMYGQNVFDCSQREAMKLLLHNIGIDNFTLIKTVALDWEQLQEFAWSLAKDEYQVATRGLECVQLAHWRNRVVGGSSNLWRNMKNYERQLCEAALDICEKHRKLKVVAQQPFHRSGRFQGSVSPRVKWRFVASVDDLRDGETVVDLEADLSLLQPTREERVTLMFPIDTF